MMHVDHLRSVPLDELGSLAALQTRYDRKYLVPTADIAEILATIADVRVLEVEGRRTFRYRSVYFDTPHLTLFLMSARGRPRRAKVRTRSYLDTNHTFLEVKVRDGRGRTVKHRYPFVGSDRRPLDREARRSVAGALGEAADCRLSPVLVTTFDRTTLLLADGSRATIDQRLRLETTEGVAIELDGSVVETKSSGPPTPLDRLLWSAHHRPIRFSKYGTGLAALDHGLPSNRWARILRTLDGERPPTHDSPRYPRPGRLSASRPTPEEPDRHAVA
ncbi:MAG: polyphosphate polymerase domain-containing protein [Aeromicrobium sp.]